MDVRDEAVLWRPGKKESSLTLRVGVIESCMVI